MSLRTYVQRLPLSVVGVSVLHEKPPDERGTMTAGGHRRTDGGGRGANGNRNKGWSEGDSCRLRCSSLSLSLSLSLRYRQPRGSRHCDPSRANVGSFHRVPSISSEDYSRRSRRLSGASIPWAIGAAMFVNDVAWTQRVISCRAIRARCLSCYAIARAASTEGRQPRGSRECRTRARRGCVRIASHGCRRPSASAICCCREIARPLNSLPLP